MLCKDDSQEMSNEETNTSSSHQQGAEDVCVFVFLHLETRLLQNKAQSCHIYACVIVML